MDYAFLESFLTARYMAIQRRDASHDDFGPAEEQAADSSLRHVQKTLLLYERLDRAMLDFESRIHGVHLTPRSNNLYSVDFRERYVEKFGPAMGDRAEDTFETKGERIHRALVLSSGKTWRILEHAVYDLDLSPTPGDDAGEKLMEPPWLGQAIAPLDGVGSEDPRVLWTWNGAASASYAEQYWQNYNDDYRSYTNDCTNFVSQCLKAGGKTDRDGDREDNKYWFYGAFEFTTSYTWAGAHNLFLHLKDHTNSRLAPSNGIAGLRPGDIVFMDFEGDGHIDHATIVSALATDDVLLTYHTTNTLRKSFRYIQQHNPQYRFWGLIIGDSYRG